MKCALIVYHKNVYSIYPKHWVDKFRDSILNQSRKDFDIIELNYGTGNERIFENSEFIQKQFPTFVDGMNYLLGLCFDERGYDGVFNTNADDWYTHDRVEKQLDGLKKGFDIVSCNFALVDENEHEYRRHSFHKSNLRRELFRQHNIIAHPAVAYSSKAWKRGMRYVPDEIPYEDLKLWQRLINRNRFLILPDCLLFHRTHPNSVCQNPENR